MYIQWAEVLKKVGLVDEVAAVIMEASKCYSSSCEVWLTRLAWEQLSNSQGVQDVFEEAVKNVEKKVRFCHCGAFLGSGVIQYRL